MKISDIAKAREFVVERELASKLLALTQAAVDSGGAETYVRFETTDEDAGVAVDVDVALSALRVLLATYNERLKAMGVEIAERMTA